MQAHIQVMVQTETQVQVQAQAWVQVLEQAQAHLQVKVVAALQAHTQEQAHGKQQDKADAPVGSRCMVRHGDRNWGTCRHSCRGRHLAGPRCWHQCG